MGEPQFINDKKTMMQEDYFMMCSKIIEKYATLAVEAGMPEFISERRRLCKEKKIAEHADLVNRIY